MASYTDKQDFAEYKGKITYQDLNELAANDQYLYDNLYILENRTDDPASPVSGQMWLRTDLP